MSMDYDPEDDDGHGPWFYTEYGVLCSCRYPVDKDERCTRPRGPAAEREALFGALFEMVDGVLDNITYYGSIAVNDGHVDDLRAAHTAIAEWHAHHKIENGEWVKTS